MWILFPLQFFTSCYSTLMKFPFRKTAPTGIKALSVRSSINSLNSHASPLSSLHYLISFSSSAFSPPSIPSLPSYYLPLHSKLSWISICPAFHLLISMFLFFQLYFAIFHLYPCTFLFPKATVTLAFPPLFQLPVWRFSCFSPLPSPWYSFISSSPFSSLV